MGQVERPRRRRARLVPHGRPLALQVRKHDEARRRARPQPPPPRAPPTRLPGRRRGGTTRARRRRAFPRGRASGRTPTWWLLMRRESKRGSRSRHEQVARGAEHQAGLPLLDDARTERARGEVAASRRRRASLRAGRSPLAASRVTRTEDIVRPQRGAAGAARDIPTARAPSSDQRAGARVEERRAEHRRRRIARGLAGEPQARRTRATAGRARRDRASSRLVRAQPGELRPEVVGVHPVAADRLGAARTERRVEGARLARPHARRARGSPDAAGDRRRRRAPPSAPDRSRPPPRRRRAHPLAAARAHAEPTARHHASASASARPGAGASCGHGLARLGDELPPRVEDGGAHAGRADVDAEQQLHGSVRRRCGPTSASHARDDGHHLFVG